MGIDEWIDISIVGSSYEVQMRLRKMCGLAGIAMAVYRHRKPEHSYHDRSMFPATAWVDGLPPKERR